MEWRPNAFRSTGAEHARYRNSTVAALCEVEMFTLHHTVERIAFPLINAFCETVTADIISQYAYPLTFEIVNTLLDCPPDMRLAVPAEQLTWCPGPFHRALTALPVVFPPAPP